MLRKLRNTTSIPVTQSSMVYLLWHTPKETHWLRFSNNYLAYEYVVEFKLNNWSILNGLVVKSSRKG